MFGFKKLYENKPKTTDPSPVPIKITPFTYIFFPGKYLLHSTMGIMKFNPETKPNTTPYKAMKAPKVST